MAAYAAVASLLNNIDHIMNHPRFSTSLDLNQIQSIEEKAALLLDFIQGYSHGGVITGEAQDLERQIASAAHAADDVIESHIVDQIHGDERKTSYCFSLNILKQIRGGIGSSQSTSTYLLDLQQIIEDMDAVLRNAYELKGKEGLREEHPSRSNSTPAMIGLGEEQLRGTMVGLEDDLIQLMDDLTNQQSSRNIISIVGTGGLGKTTLAQNLYQSLLIKQYFDMHAWITVSQQYNLEEMLSQLLSSLGKSSSAASVDDLGEMIHKTLSGRRYLIVLDDVWSVQVWDELKHFFPDNGNGSRVVLTTRLSNVARSCHSRSCLMMKPLDEQTSWKLFCKEAFKQESCPYPELEEVGKEIARLCRGLPLATVVVGGLLLNSPKSKVSTVLGEWRIQIRVSKIIELWIAEGFLRPKDAQVLDKVAESYLKELIDRNLVSVRKHRHNGTIGSCGIHDLVRDLCLKLGEQQGFFHVSETEIQENEFRVSLHRYICSGWVNIQHNGPSQGCSMLSRAFIGLNHHKLLRVLNAEGSVSEHLYENANLRYLAYSPLFHYQSVWKLPSSISHIWNLQTLIFHKSNRVIVALTEIWNMRQLRHVKCFLMYVPNPPRQSNGLVRMDSLQALTKAVNMKVSEKVCKIPHFIKQVELERLSPWVGRCVDDWFIAPTPSSPSRK
ncbi:putative late blight resistance protein homolog R1A-3 [Salvia hispanica]|uniref:putative late blight resistance protein homolog R1A-3 n=1 Tax=Salvia hispanica TaxID=49212 RepID=UPI002009A4B8|nr:putative late blight resistance protein homolog R1A-3 [Salvia hispanica]